MIRQIIMLLSLFAVSSCSSQSKFEGSGSAAGDVKVKPPTEPKPVVDPTIPPVLPSGPSIGLTWNADCSQNQVTEVDSATAIQLKGFGEKTLESPVLALQKLNSLKISGAVCKPSESPRDIIFIVDVSGSMDEITDPITNGNCWRSTAITSAIKAIGENSIHRFAVVTFSSTIRAKSTNFFSNRTDLFKDLTKTNNAVTDVLCAAYDGTYYDEGISGAKKIFTQDARESLKEIYFISDGMPNEGHDGIAAAAELKSTGIQGPAGTQLVNIATIMIGFFEDDTKLRSVASVNANNIPLHARISDASKLVVTLNQLAASLTTSAQLTIKAIGSSLQKSFDIFKILKGDQFDMDALEFKSEDYPHGIQFSIETHDNRSRTMQKTSNIHWN